MHPSVALRTPSVGCAVGRRGAPSGFRRIYRRQLVEPAIRFSACAHALGHLLEPLQHLLHDGELLRQASRLARIVAIPLRWARIAPAIAAICPAASPPGIGTVGNPIIFAVTPGTWPAAAPRRSIVLQSWLSRSCGGFGSLVTGHAQG